MHKQKSSVVGRSARAIVVLLCLSVHPYSIALAGDEPLPLASGWSAYGDGYAPPMVAVENGIVVVSGLARAASSQWAQIATLPAHARPPKRLAFTLDNHDKSARVDVFPDGRITWIQGGHDHGWLSLDGIRFAQKADVLLALPSAWVSYSDVYDPGVYAPPSAAKRGDRVVLNGTVLKRSGAFQPGETIATLPAGYRPPVPLIFSANGGSKVQRVDAYPDGRLVWVGGEHEYPWVSLDGLAFSLKAGTALAPRNGWTAYGGGHPAPAAIRDGNVVMLAGLLKGEGPRNQPVAQLPPEMRPAARRIFHSGADQYSLRVDIDADGWLRVIAGQGTGWITLSGIVFPAATAAAPAPAAVVVPKPVAAAQRQPLQLVAGWTNYGDGYSPPTVAISGNLVVVSGLARAGTWGHIATLPANARPPRHLIFNLNNHAYTTRVDVLPDGRLFWVAGGRDHGWLSLTGISFSREPGTPLALGSGWRDFGPANNSPHGPASVTRTGDLVVVSGLVEKPAGGFRQGEVIATLPVGARPAQSLIFNVNGNSGTQRLDIAADGRIFWNTGEHDYDWVSLDGITFSAQPGANLSLAAGNAPYGSGWTAPQASRIGDIVSVSGLVKPGDLGQPLLVLPPNLRPGGRMIFNQGSDANPLRIDILPNGEVRHAAGPTAIGWVNLSGIAFPLGIEAPVAGNTPATVAPAPPSSPMLTAARSLASGFPALKSGWAEWEKLFSQDGELFQANVTIANQKATLVVYRPIVNQAPVNIAVLASNLTLGHLIKPAGGTPADDLTVDNAAYIYVPDGNFQSLDVSSLPPVVRGQVSKSRTGPIELLEGQNLFALVNPKDGGTTAQLLRLVGAPLENLKVHVGYGSRREKDKPVPYQSVRLTRAGNWNQPFHLKDTALENPTLEFAKSGNVTTLRAWGMGRLKQKDYFVFLQKHGAKGSFPTAAALDARSITLKDYKDVALVFGETLLGSTGAMQTLLGGIDQVPLDKVEIENPNYRAGGALDADNNPVFANVLVMAAAPGDTLPDAKKTAGPIMLAHGKGKVFGFTAGSVDGWVRSTKGMDVTASVDLPRWGAMSLGKFGLGLYRDGSRYNMDLKGHASVPYIFKEDVTLKASNSGFSFNIGPNCPLRYFGISGSVNGHDIGQGSGFTISSASGDPLTCVTGPMKELAGLLMDGVEQVNVGATVVKRIGNDAWAGLVKEGGGAISSQTILKVTNNGMASTTALLENLGDVGKKEFKRITGAIGGFFGGSSGGGEKPRYFNKPSLCGSNDNWNIVWGTCWRKGHELVKMGEGTDEYCMSVNGRKKIKDREIQLERCHGDWNQQWRQFSSGEIRHGWGADHCIDSGAKSPAGSGRRVNQNACNSEGDQRFYRDRYDRLIGRDGWCLEAEANSVDTNVRVQPCKLDASGQNAYQLQKWKFSAKNSSFPVLSDEDGCRRVSPGNWDAGERRCRNRAWESAQAANRLKSGAAGIGGFK